MNKIPLPDSIPIEYKLLLWIIAVLIIIIGWFLINYINRNKEDIEEIKKSIKDQSDKIEEQGVIIKSQYVELKKSELNNKKEINENVIKIKESNLELLKTIEPYNLSFYKIETKLENIQAKTNSLEKINKLIDTHAHTLELTFKILTDHRSNLSNLKTEIIKISEDLLMLKNKR